MKHITILLIACATLTAAEEDLVTTWRGPNYDGVMPAKGLVKEFVWYDENGPNLAELRPKEKARLFLEDFSGKPDWPKPGTKINTCWRTPLPSWGQSAPVAVGDKIFVTCDAILQTNGQHQLVCVDIPSGEIAWTKPIDHLLAWEDTAKAAEIQKIRMAEVEGWAEAMRTWNGVWWDNERHVRYGSKDHPAPSGWQGSSERMGKPHPDRQEAYDKAVAAGYEAIHRAYHRNFGRHGRPERIEEWKKASLTRARVYSHNKDKPWYGSTMASVVGDGTAVYAVAAPDAVVCYELDGSLRWAADMEVGGRPERRGYVHVHRNMTSPILVADTLVYFNTNDMRVFAYECASGKLRWKSSLPAEVDTWKKKEYRELENGLFPRGYGGHMGPGGTPVPMTLRDGDTDVPVVVIPSGHVFRVADGAFLGWFNVFNCDEAAKEKKGTLIINAKSTYGTSVAVGDVYVSVHGNATRLGLADGRLVAEEVWRHARDSRGRVGNDSNQSLIAVPGKGVVAGGGALWDLATGKDLVHGLRPSGDSYTSGCISADGLLLWNGGDWGADRFNRLAPCFRLVELARPERHGPGRGIGLIVETGTNAIPDFEQRIIDRFGVDRIHSGWPHPTAFGNRIFVRTNTHLYCFGKGPWQSFE